MTASLLRKSLWPGWGCSRSHGEDPLVDGSLVSRCRGVDGLRGGASLGLMHDYLSMAEVRDKSFFVSPWACIGQSRGSWYV